MFAWKRLVKTEVAVQTCSIRKSVLRNFTKFTWKHLCQSLFCNFIEKETLTQVFSCEFCEISKNTLSYRTPLVAVSVKKRLLLHMSSDSKIQNGKKRSRCSPPRFWVRPHRNLKWWNDFMNGNMIPEEWKENFRTWQRSFYILWE